MHRNIQKPKTSFQEKCKMHSQYKRKTEIPWDFFSHEGVETVCSAIAAENAKRTGGEEGRSVWYQWDTPFELSWL